MVQVLLIILKVLGITLLILLGFVLLVVLLALLVPFCYTVDAEYYGDIRAVGRIRWLCFVLDLKGVYGNSKFLYYLKSFGFTISTNDENDKHFQKEVEEETYDTKEDAYQVPVQLVTDDFEDYMKEQEHPEAQVPESLMQQPEEKKRIQTKPSEQQQTIEERTRLPNGKRGIFLRIHDKVKQAVEWVTSIPMRIHYKISEILSRILDFLANIKENINRLIKKKNEIVKKVTEIRGFLQKPVTQQAWKDSKKYLWKLLKHIGPRRFHGTIHFGMEDPSTTGQVLGAVSLLMPWYQDHIVVAPDFEQQIFEGQLYAKGRVQIGFFLMLGLRILLNRNILRTIQEARTIIGGNK